MRQFLASFLVLVFLASAPIAIQADGIATAAPESAAPTIASTPPVSSTGPPDLSGKNTPGNKILRADLTHETYTATSDLAASFVFPIDGGVSPDIATRVVIDTTFWSGHRSAR